MRVLSLFSGIGGFEIACEWAGMEIAGQVDIDPFCRKVLDKHWPDVPKWRDIFELTGEEILDKCGRIDLLSGGFPCQPFSAAGKRKGQADERYLWPEMLRIIREVKPKWVLGENVRGILSINSGRVFGTILADLAESGYRVGWLCYGAGDVGAPHKRERVFIVAHSESIGRRGWSNGDEGGRSGEIQTSRSCSPEERAYMADTEEYRQWPGLCQNEQVWRWGRFGDKCSADVAADTSKQGLQRSEWSETFDEGERSSRPTAKCSSDTGPNGAVESGLGGVLNGFPCGMDGTKWPAGRWQTPSVEDAGRTGSEEAWMEYEKDGRTTQCRLRNQIWAHWPAGPGEQYPWEPPRIATGIKDRVARLKALGNAVVPAQVYPILKAISEIERGIQK